MNKGRERVQKRAQEGHSSVGKVTEAWVLELLPCVKTGELGVLVNVVGESVVLLVHDALVAAKLKAKEARQVETNVVDGLGLEGVSVKELVLSSDWKRKK